MIGLLNSRFVPVYTSNEDTDEGGAASAEEKKAYTKIYHGSLKAGFSCGSVCVYIVSPEGDPVDAKTVPDLPKVRAMLGAAIERFSPKEGEPVVAPRPQSSRPAAAADALVLHLSAPYDRREGSWHEFPAESWLVFPKAEWTKMLPGGAVKPGTSWDVDAAVVARLYNHFYPATEDTQGEQIGRNKIEEQSLKATVLSVADGTARARLEGRLRMTRPFYPNHPEHKPCVVTASVLGVLDFAADTSQIRSLRMATEKASLDAHGFGVGVRTVPAAP